MEVVEEANRAAVVSCKKLVARLSQPGVDPIRLAAVAAQTDDAVSRFGKVVTILSNRVGHARARLGQRSSPPVDASYLLDYHPIPPVPYCPPPSGLHLHGSSSTHAPPLPQMHVPVVVAAPCAAGNGKIVAPAAMPADGDRNMFMDTPLFDMSVSGCTVPSSMAAAAQITNTSKVPATPAANPPPPPPPPPACNAQIQFHHIQHQQQQQKRFKFEQKPAGEKPFHIEMPMAAAARSGKEPEVITFSFDNSVCTSSAATSFFTGMSSQLISMSDNSAAAPSSRKAPHCGRKADDDDGKCHCPKKKRPREKRVVRMPAVSDKVADIPSDSYSWRKYGQKPIKGSPHPRGYYRCSSIKDCPARKHVERCRGDAGMLIVTYENDHNHAQPLDISALVAHSEA